MRYILALAMTGVFSTPSVAQPPLADPNLELPRQEFISPPGMGVRPGSSMPGADPFMLLTNSRAVHQDLQLTEEQIRHLAHTGKLFRGQMEEGGASGKPPSADAMVQQVAMSRGAVAKILSSAQLDRLQQIMLQIEGPCVLAQDQRLAEQLGVDPGQQERIGHACREMGAQAAAVRQPPPGQNPCRAMQQNREDVERIRAKSGKEVLALLTEIQKGEFRRLQGAKIVLEPMMPPECMEGTAQRRTSP